MLLLSPNEVVSVDRLIDELWRHAAPGDAAHTVQVFVSRLRKAIGRNVVETAAPGYRARVAVEQVDLLRFEHLRSAGSHALEQGRAGLARRTLTEALTLFRGPPLADFAYEPWALPEIERIEDERLSCLEQRVDADLALGRHAELTAELERAVRDNPSRERLWSQLMLSLYRSGRQAEALERYQHLRATLDSDLGIEPSSELKDLQRRILNQDPALNLDAIPPTGEIKLPRPATPFLGRRREVAEIRQLLSHEDVRLLTLTGPGGSGKSRLAVEAASEVASTYSHGTVWVPLASVREPSLVLPTIAATLDVGGDLAQGVADRELLLVLDNFEQVLRAAVDLAGILSQAPQLTMLVTSREPLRVYGEHEYRVPTLATNEAIALFEVRARAVQGEVGSGSTVREICARLDRLPLAIELAAAHTRSFSPEIILARLQRRLPLLVGGPRDADERHQTLRAAIEWSYDLLGDAERSAFRRLAVFAGGCPTEAAESICDTSFDVLAALAAKNLLRSSSDRIWMLETIREYAAELLDESADAQPTHRAHAHWCLELFEAGVAASNESLERALLEQHNLRAALSWARASAEPVLALELAIKIGELLSVRGSLAEARQLLDVTLAEATEAPAEARAQALHEAAGIALKQGDSDAVRSLSEAALQLAGAMDDTQATVRALAKLAVVALEEGDLARASGYSKQATELASQADDERAHVNALNVFGTVELARKNYGEARAAFEQALGLVSSRLGATRRDTFATLHYNIALAAFLGGDVAAAEQTLDRTLGLYRSLGHLEGVAYCFVVEAARRAKAHEIREAAERLTAAQRLLEEVDAALEPVERSLADSTWALVFAGLDDQSFAAVRQAGIDRAEAEIERLSAGTR